MRIISFHNISVRIISCCIFQIIQTVCGKTVSASVVIAMSGIAKVYVGEIVEKALDVKTKCNDYFLIPLKLKYLIQSNAILKLEINCFKKFIIQW